MALVRKNDLLSDGDVHGPQPEKRQHPMWLQKFEDEMSTLRKNVENELITGLREKLESIVADAITDLAAKSEEVGRRQKGGRSKNADRWKEATGLRNAAATDDADRSGGVGVDMPVPKEANTKQWMASSNSRSNEREPVPMPIERRLEARSNGCHPRQMHVTHGGVVEDHLVLPHCVGDTNRPQSPDMNGDSRPGSAGELSTTSMNFGDAAKAGTIAKKISANQELISGLSSHTGSRFSRFSKESMSYMDLANTILNQDDETILKRKGVLWAVDPATHRIARWVRRDLFDYFMGLVLVLNSILIGHRVDWEASHLGATDKPIFVWMDRLFCLMFLIELCMRLYTFRLAFYLTDGWQWACFDTVVVAFQVVEQVALMLAEGRDSAMDLGFLKMLKMGRLARMVRMIRLLPELKSLVLLIAASMSSFVWTCFLLMLLVYILAVYMVMMAVDSLEQSIGEESLSRTELQLYWGSMGSAVLSCYWCITGGQDWAVIIGPLVEETGTQVHNVVFCMFVAFATMVLMNLVTGVFVEGARQIAKKDKDKELSKMAHKVFRMLDDDVDEEISRTEFNRHLKQGNLDTYLATVELERTHADNLFEILDKDKTNTISVPEFIEGCIRLRGPARSCDVAQLILEYQKEHKHQFHDMSTSLKRLQSDMKHLRYEMQSEPGSPH